jgi:hypothetical protein
VVTSDIYVTSESIAYCLERDKPAIASPHLTYLHFTPTAIPSPVFETQKYLLPPSNTAGHPQACDCASTAIYCPAMFTFTAASMGAEEDNVITKDHLKLYNLCKTHLQQRY